MTQMQQDSNTTASINHLPAMPNNALSYLCKISQSLLDLAERESQALIQNDIMALAILQDEKENLSQRYMESSQEFRARVNEFRSSDKGLIHRLEKLQKQLAERSDDNNVLIAQIRDRAERNTQKTLLMAQEYGKSPRAKFPDIGRAEEQMTDHKGA